MVSAHLTTTNFIYTYSLNFLNPAIICSLGLSFNILSFLQQIVENSTFSLKSSWLFYFFENWWIMHFVEKFCHKCWTEWCQLDGSSKSNLRYQNIFFLWFSQCSWSKIFFFPKIRFAFIISEPKFTVCPIKECFFFIWT